MAQVQMPDGAIVEMPDQLSPELGSRLRAFQSAHGQKQPTQGDDPKDMSFGRQLLGNAELAGSAIANIPHGILHAASDIVNRVTGDYSGKDPGWIDALHVEPGAAGKELSSALSQGLEQTIDQAGGGDVATRAAGAVDEFGRDAAGHPVAGFVRNVVAPLTSDVATLAGARAPVTGAAQRVIGAVRNGGAATAASGSPFRPPAETPEWARTVAGSSGQEALNRHYQQIGNAVATGEANVPTGTALGYEELDKAAKAPSDVYTRIAANLPEGAVDPTAQQGIDAAGTGRGGLVTMSDAAKATVDRMKTQLKQSMTGQQLMDNMRSLRQEGFKRAASEDVDQQAIGQAQLDMARALEGHVGRNLPQGGDVTLAQFQTARKALAKNYTVQGALRGSDVDMNAIARVQRADPELLDGGLKEIADFANGPGRGLTGLPNQYTTSPMGEAAMDAVDLHQPVRGVVKFLGGATARRVLTGNTARAVQAAQDRFGANPRQFDPLPGMTPPPGSAGRTPTQLSLGDLPQGPGPAPWTLGEGATPPRAAPAAAPEQMSLADLLSHGVEQNPPEGLSVAPMGAPPREGLPFTPNLEHAAGGLELAPEDSWFKGGHTALGDDLAGVMSQGVPEGTMARAPARRFVGDTVDFPSGTPRRQIIENNASGESAASVEAQRRLAGERASGSAPFMIDPEGAPQALAHTVDAVDVKAPKGHLKVQRDPTTGKLSIVDRGGLTLAAAKGLLNRYLALHQSLGDELGGAT